MSRFIVPPKNRVQEKKDPGTKGTNRFKCGSLGRFNHTFGKKLLFN